MDEFLKIFMYTNCKVDNLYDTFKKEKLNTKFNFIMLSMSLLFAGKAIWKLDKKVQYLNKKIDDLENK